MAFKNMPNVNIGDFCKHGHIQLLNKNTYQNRKIKFFNQLVPFIFYVKIWYLAKESSSHLAADTTRNCYCGKKTTVEKVTFKLKKDKEFNSTELLLVKPPIYNGKEGNVKIYHAIWPEKGRCVAIKFLIKNSDETKNAVRKEIAVFEHFYGPGENKKINGPIRIVEYFGQ